MNWWKAVGFAGYMLGWLTRAAQDGKITTAEMIELVTAAVEQFGLDVEIDVPTPPLASKETAKEFKM